MLFNTNTNDNIDVYINNQKIKVKKEKNKWKYKFSNEGNYIYEVTLNDEIQLNFKFQLFKIIIL